MAFPTSPTDGQTAIVNSVTYQYANSTNAWTRILSTANIITANTIAVNGNISAAGNVSGTYIAGTLTTANQPNITNLGNLISLTVSNSSGVVNFSNTSNVTLGSVGNLHISGGTANYVLSTNGSGSLSWAPQSEALTVVVDDFTGDGSTTVYTLSVTPGSINDTTVNYNGAILLRTSYSLSVANITFSSPPENGSEIEVTTIGGSFGGGGGTPGGANTQVQFNDDTVFGGSAAFTFNKTSNTLAVGGLISAVGNVVGNYILGNGALLTGLAATYGNANVVANLAALGSNPVSTTGNITSGNFLTGGLISAVGNVVGNYILGNGALLTGVITSVANINNGTSNVTVVSSNGNVSVGIGGTGNIAVFATSGEYVTGEISASGNITGSYIFGNGSQLTGLAATYGNANVVANLAALGSNPVSTTGNITSGNFLTGGLFSVAGNVTANNGMFTNIVNVASHTGAVVSVTANVTGGNLLTVGLVSATGNVTGNYLIGNGSVLSNLRPNLSMTVALSDETTTITTGTKITFRAPVAMTLYQIPRASLTTASSVGNPTIDINKNGVSIFSTTLTIDATETTSVTAVTAAVLSTTSIDDNDIITMDVDVAGTSAAGLKVTLYYTQT
jgi:hypothetical protein